MKNLILFILFCCSVLVNAQEQEKKLLVGSLNLDARVAFDSTSTLSEREYIYSQQKRSPILAGGMSFVLPGSGQFYNEDYWKTAIFAAVETAAIVTAVMYDKKGDNQTTNYQNFANEHWDVARYARWTITNLNTLNGNLDPSNYSGLFLNQAETQVNWDVLNRLEGDIGGYYSHRLAPFQDQQYFEMIGKYPQFNVGWDDFGDENTPFQYGNPVTDKFSYYSGERGKANDFYTVSKTAVIIVVTNHVLSALEAAWSAGRFNKNLKMKMNLQTARVGYRIEFFPQLNFEYRF